MDWTKYTKKPTDPAVTAKVRDHLLSLREIVCLGDRTDYLVAQAFNKTVLDVGVCGGAEALISDSTWLHRRVIKVASEVLGVDVLEHDIELLRREGFNVRCVDATSDVDIGKKFELVLFGDVIEHVENPVALLRFGNRHLSKHGQVLVSSPNPHYYRFRRALSRGNPLVPNLEHVSWITPAYAMELGRRAGLSLVRYTCFINRTRLFKRRVICRPPSEEYTSDYVYHFERAS